MSEISLQVLNIVSWIFTGLAILLTASRFWIRCKIIKRVSWDDAAHLLGLLLLLAQVSIITAAASMLYQDLVHKAGDDNLYDAGQSLFIRLNVACILITWCCLYAVKASFLLLYRHIFKISKSFIRAWWFVLGIVVITFWILVAGTLTQCGNPVDLENASTCDSSVSVEIQTDNRQIVAALLPCSTDRIFLSSTVVF